MNHARRLTPTGAPELRKLVREGHVTVGDVRPRDEYEGLPGWRDAGFPVVSSA